AVPDEAGERNPRRRPPPGPQGVEGRRTRQGEKLDPRRVLPARRPGGGAPDRRRGPGARGGGREYREPAQPGGRGGRRRGDAGARGHVHRADLGDRPAVHPARGGGAGQVRRGGPRRRFRDRRGGRLREGEGAGVIRSTRSPARMNPDWRTRYELAVEVARQAGDLAKSIYDTAVEVEWKADQSPVSVPDRHG